MSDQTKPTEQTTPATSSPPTVPTWAEEVRLGVQCWTSADADEVRQRLLAGMHFDKAVRDAIAMPGDGKGKVRNTVVAEITSQLLYKTRQAIDVSLLIRSYHAFRLLESKGMDVFLNVAPGGSAVPCWTAWVKVLSRLVEHDVASDGQYDYHLLTGMGEECVKLYAEHGFDPLPDNRTSETDPWTPGLDRQVRKLEAEYARRIHAEQKTAVRDAGKATAAAKKAESVAAKKVETATTDAEKAAAAKAELEAKNAREKAEAVQAKAEKAAQAAKEAADAAAVKAEREGKKGKGGKTAPRDQGADWVKLAMEAFRGKAPWDVAVCLAQLVWNLPNGDDGEADPVAVFGELQELIDYTTDDAEKGKRRMADVSAGKIGRDKVQFANSKAGKQEQAAA